MEALLELYERHRTVTYGFFRRRIGIPEIAAEENQELYLTMLDTVEQVEENVRMGGFGPLFLQRRNRRRGAGQSPTLLSVVDETACGALP